MREFLAEVLALQLDYSSSNTPAMQRRGQIIRDDLPKTLRALDLKLRRTLGPAGKDLKIEGRDGTGRKAEVPWVRFCSELRSPSAQSGWYAVFLFHARGEGAYLWLGHGSTQLEGGSYVARDEAEVAAKLSWARALLDDTIAANPRLRPTIELGSAKPLPQAYEKSALAGFWYPANDLPSDHTLEADCITMAGMLSVLYNAADLGRQPNTPSPDVEAAIQAASIISGGGRPTGQGYGLTHRERQAVERHAMEVVSDLLKGEGYAVEDVSAKQPVDFLAGRDGEIVYVEVKGTTGPPGSVMLTANEVALHRKRWPHNALMIVHSITLERTSESPKASGGAIMQVRPWEIQAAKLRAISFQYVLEDEPAPSLPIDR